jgi:hypothetical protein
MVIRSETRWYSTAATFNMLHFSAATDSSYKITTIEVTEISQGTDHPVTFDVTATDGDMDTAVGAFSVTFDGDGTLHGEVPGIEVIKGGSGTETIIANDGTYDHIDGGGGGDTIHYDIDIDTLVLHPGDDPIPH